MTIHPLNVLRRPALIAFAVAGVFLPQIGQAQMPGASVPALPSITVTQSAHGLHASVGKETVDVTVCGGSVIHVATTPEGVPDTSLKPWILGPKNSCPGGDFQYANDGKTATLTTSRLKVQFSLERGNLVFEKADGSPLLREGNAVPRTYKP
ncbi:MAG: hypothetical protein ACRD3F_15530, partial [Acidobacteriaceae bacterium]